MMDAVDEVTERKIQLDEQHDDKALAQREEKVSPDDEKDVRPDAKPKTSKTHPLKHRYRLLGKDNLLVRAGQYFSAKHKQRATVWAVVVPTSLIHAVLRLFHGDRSPIGHGGNKTFVIGLERAINVSFAKDIRRCKAHTIYIRRLSRP